MCNARLWDVMSWKEETLFVINNGRLPVKAAIVKAENSLTDSCKRVSTMASLGGGAGDIDTPNESLNMFCGWIYKNSGQTITWKGGEGVSGDGSL